MTPTSNKFKNMAKNIDFWNEFLEIKNLTIWFIYVCVRMNCASNELWQSVDVHYNQIEFR